MLVAMGPTRAALKHTIGDLTSWAAAGTMPGVGARAVISLQVAIGLSLTLTGVLVVAGMVRLWGTNVGFDSDSLLVVTAETTGAPEPASVEAVIAQFLRAVRRLPGVTAAGVTRSPSILRRGVSSGPFENADTYPVSAGFFEAIRPELVAGRLPSDAQLDRRESVAVISEEVARERFGADEMALGRAIVPTDGTPALTVIAVVGETRFSGWDLAAVLRLAAEDLSPVRVLRAAEADALLGETVRPRRFVAWMYGLLAVASLAIVCAGVFGQVAMATARRSREMGIRVALGATGRGVIMLLVREQVSAALVGLAAGSLAAFWMVGLVRAYVYEVSVYDARLWLAAAVAIILAAGAAAAVPPWRASRVDPVTVLRSE